MKTDLMTKVLSGEASEEEKKQLEQWIQESKENRSAYNKALLLWKNLENVYTHTTFDSDSAMGAIRERILNRKVKRPNKTIWVKISIAASIILVIGLGLLAGYFIRNENRYDQVYLSGKTKKEVILADGSHVWLNKNSSLMTRTTFSKRNRDVRLKGEAFFEVEHDRVHPFRIVTGNATTEVIGTSFNLKIDTLTGNVDLIVNSGKVAFYLTSDKDDKVLLLPGNYAHLLCSANSIEVGKNENQNYQSWKTGVLSFYNTPMEKVCAELSEHFNKKVFSTDATKGLKLTGSFNDDSLDTILSTIQLTLEVKVSKQGNGYQIDNQSSSKRN